MIAFAHLRMRVSRECVKDKGQNQEGLWDTMVVKGGVLIALLQNWSQELTPAQYAIYEKDFNRHDKDGSGMLDRDELCDLLAKQLSRKPTEVEMDDFFSTIETGRVRRAHRCDVSLNMLSLSQQTSITAVEGLHHFWHHVAPRGTMRHLTDTQQTSVGCCR